jgi:1-deoxy-D-xylulose-5-phosphate reductoisomerase
VGTEADRKALLALLPGPARPQVEIGPRGLELAATTGDVVLSAVVGAAGLAPTWAAAVKGLKVALANKESLVMAGQILRPVLGDRLAPVDSEHSAIFQALGGTLEARGVRRLIITASGGPFRGWGPERLAAATPAMALAHPTWSMGPKISCDSATLMNKGLEVIEARHLFGIPYDNIEVLVQPGSLVHSIVEFVDGAQLAHMGPADMRLSIAYALSHPDRWPLLEARDLPGGSSDAAGLAGFSRYLPSEPRGPIAFEPPDRRSFPCLALAEAAGRAGGTAPATLNAANEVAVEAFLTGRLSFTGIPEVVDHCLQRLGAKPLARVEDALAADAEARPLAEARIRELAG